MRSIGKITGTVCRLTHNDGIKRLSLDKQTLNPRYDSQISGPILHHAVDGIQVGQGAPMLSFYHIFFGPVVEDHLIDLDVDATQKPPCRLGHMCLTIGCSFFAGNLKSTSDNSR